MKVHKQAYILWGTQAVGSSTNRKVVGAHWFAHVVRSMSRWSIYMHVRCQWEWSGVDILCGGGGEIQRGHLT
jgi:hypothetical protein